MSQSELGSPSLMITFILEGTHDSNCEPEMGAARPCYSLPLAAFKSLDKEKVLLEACVSLLCSVSVPEYFELQGVLST